MTCPRSGRSASVKLGFQGTLTPRLGLAAMIDDDLAGFLLRPPASAIPFAVAVGPPRPIERLTESFELASRTLATMGAFDMVGVYDLEALGVLPAISQNDRRRRSRAALPGAARRVTG